MPTSFFLSQVPISYFPLSRPFTLWTSLLPWCFLHFSGKIILNYSVKSIVDHEINFLCPAYILKNQANRKKKYHLVKINIDSLNFCFRLYVFVCGDVCMSLFLNMVVLCLYDQEIKYFVVGPCIKNLKATYLEHITLLPNLLFGLLISNSF